MINVINLFLALLSFSSNTNTQNVTPCDSSYRILEKDTVYFNFEIEPSFPGGFQRITNHFTNNIDLSKISSTQQSGKIKLRIIINPEGKVVNVLPSSTINQSNSEFEEFRRVALLMPEWEPAYCGGRAIFSELTLPIFYYPK